MSIELRRPSPIEGPTTSTTTHRILNGLSQETKAHRKNPRDEDWETKYIGVNNELERAHAIIRKLKTRPNASPTWIPHDTQWIEHTENHSKTIEKDIKLLNVLVMKLTSIENRIEEFKAKLPLLKVNGLFARLFGVGKEAAKNIDAFENDINGFLKEYRIFMKDVKEHETLSNKLHDVIQNHASKTREYHTQLQQSGEA